MEEHRIFAVRHSQTAWSVGRRHTGRTDVPLTEEGRVAARRLAAPLLAERFGRVLSSPLGRARETCDLAGLGAGVELREELLEWDYGDYEGRTTPEIRAELPDWRLWRDGCPGGESADDVGRRVDPLVDELARSRGDVAVFAHGHVLRVLAARWLGLEAQAGALWALSTASISVLGFEHANPVLWRWNLVP